MMYRVLSLFAGIGGFDLGLEKTGGFKTVAFCEIDPFCQKVLAKHWPGVPCYDDVRTLTGERLAADGIAVNVICGGFPCQDISFAGRGAGLAGERSGLWTEYARLIGELRPRYVIVENVSALLNRGLGDVLGDLAKIGYDAEWHCIPASAVGAPHRRDRIWIVANPTRERRRETRGHSERPAQRAAIGSEVLADAMRGRRSRQRQFIQPSNPAPLIQRQAVDAFHGSVGGIWTVEPSVGRVAHGVPDRAHRLKALGNAVIPQIPELIGRAILAADQRERAAA